MLISGGTEMFPVNPYQTEIKPALAGFKLLTKCTFLELPGGG